MPSFLQSFLDGVNQGADLPGAMQNRMIAQRQQQQQTRQAGLDAIAAEDRRRKQLMENIEAFAAGGDIDMVAQYLDELYPDNATPPAPDVESPALSADTAPVVEGAEMESAGPMPAEEWPGVGALLADDAAVPIDPDLAGTETPLPAMDSPAARFGLQQAPSAPAAPAAAMSPNRRLAMRMVQSKSASKLEKVDLERGVMVYTRPDGTTYIDPIDPMIMQGMLNNKRNAAHKPGFKSYNPTAGTGLTWDGKVLPLDEETIEHIYQVNKRREDLEATIAQRNMRFQAIRRAVDGMYDDYLKLYSDQDLNDEDRVRQFKTMYGVRMEGMPPLYRGQYLSMLADLSARPLQLSKANYSNSNRGAVSSSLQLDVDARRAIKLLRKPHIVEKLGKLPGQFTEFKGWLSGEAGRDPELVELHFIFSNLSDKITRIRTGAALTENEAKFYANLLGSFTKNSEASIVRLQQLIKQNAAAREATMRTALEAQYDVLPGGKLPDEVESALREMLSGVDVAESGAASDGGASKQFRRFTSDHLRKG